MSTCEVTQDVRTLIFLTRSTTEDALLRGHFSSSSQAYEVRLVHSLSRVENMRIDCIALIDAGRRRAPFALNERLTYASFGRLTLISIVPLALSLLKARQMKRAAVLTTGYYPLEMLLMLFARLIGMEAYSVVFDTHLTASAKMGLFKRVLANAYFGCGYFMLKRLSGVIVLNERFLLKDGFNTRVLKTRVGGLFSSCPARAASNSRDQGDRIKLLFAGTINDDNGVEIILSALRDAPNLAVDICFYGDGDASHRVVEASAGDARIKYYGRIADADLDEKLLDADYLVCLRDPECLASSYSFPSKLIKFMGSGVPVIANVFPGLDSYADKLLLISSYSSAAFFALASELVRVGSDVETGTRARNFVEFYNDWEKIAADFAEFTLPRFQK